MPAMMSVAEFLDEARDDFNSPTTSTFVRRMAQCRQTVCALEESLDYDRDGLSKMKKALKTIYNGGNSHVDNEVYLSKALERLGTNAMTKDQEPDIGAAFIKFSIVTKELSALMKTLMQNLNNVVMFPLDNILKGDLKGVKGDLKKPFDKAWREYEGKLSKIEKEKKAQAKEVGMIRTEISPAEIAEELDKEKKWLQLQMCEYLLKANEIKTKKGVELLQHLVDYYHAQTSYFQDGLKTIEHFNGYINELSSKIAKIKCKQDEERKKLLDLRNILKSSGGFGSENVNSTSNLLPYHGSNYNSNSNTLSSTYNYDGHGGFGGSESGTSRKKDSYKAGIYSLHQLQGNKHYGCFKSGHLLKKSEGKMRMKVWQKRKCEVKDGFLFISHSDDSKAPTKVNLLTCQVKYIPDEKKSFDLVSCNRTYHFQVEDENEIEAWISVLINSKEGALKKEFDSNNDSELRSFSGGGNSTSSGIGTSIDSRYSRNSTNLSLHELRQSILKYISKLPGNDRCVDCGSTSDATWLSTNFGVIVCIECSGIHRELGVHISRIQSLTLDNIGTSQLLLARVMSNHAFNDIMEATLSPSQKPKATASMDARYEYIKAKYVDRKFVLRSCNGVINDLKADLEHAIQSKHIYSLLQVWAEGADLTWTLPSASNGETALHYAIANEDSTSLHMVDFLVQNSAELLDKATKDGNTPLHWTVEHNQSECMKLLLRSGANPRKVNSMGKTPLDLAKEAKHEHLAELIEHACKNKKGLFENVIIDWNLGSGEDGSTDFSDDDLIDEKALSKHYFDWLLFGYNSNVNKKGSSNNNATATNSTATAATASIASANNNNTNNSTNLSTSSSTNLTGHPILSAKSANSNNTNYATSGGGGNGGNSSSNNGCNLYSNVPSHPLAATAAAVAASSSSTSSNLINGIHHIYSTPNSHHYSSVEKLKVKNSTSSTSSSSKQQMVQLRRKSSVPISNSTATNEGPDVASIEMLYANASISVTQGNLVNASGGPNGGNGSVDKNNLRSSSVLSNESPMSRSSGSFKKRNDASQQSLRRSSGGNPPGGGGNATAIIINNNSSPATANTSITSTNNSHINATPGTRSSFKVKSNSITSPPKSQAQLQQQLNQQLAATVSKLNTSGSSHVVTACNISTTSNTGGHVDESHSSGDSLGGAIYSHIRTPSDPAPSVPIYAQINANRRGSGHWRSSNVSTSTPTSITTSERHAAMPMANSMIVNTNVSSLNGSLIDASIHSHQTVHANSVKVVPTSKITSNTNGSTIIITGQQSAQQPQLINSTSTSPLYSSLQRPRCPPPPLPPHQTKTTPLLRSTSNGQSHESIPSVSSVEIDSVGNPIETPISSSIEKSSHPSQSDHHLQLQAATSIPVPVPPPRKYYFQKHDLAPMAGKMRRCVALYECEADREDELSFKEGEFILITSEKTEDEDWMEGFIEGNPKRKGLFPSSFVQILPE